MYSGFSMPIKLSNDISRWASRLELYLSLYVVVIGSYLLFKGFDFWHTDVDSARYMLSALIQSEAAIVALVITLSLVAVQLAASSYSARVIDVFKRTPDLWILILIYGIAMFYGLGVLKLIEKADPQKCAEKFICSSNLEPHISLTYFLGVFAFVALVPYILSTLNMLKPSTVIGILAEQIVKKNILASLRDEQIFINHRYINQTNKYIWKDPILPIIDIVRISLMKYDYETIRDGLKAISEHANYMFINENFELGEQVSVSEHIFHHLNNLKKIAISKNDDDLTLFIAESFGEMGMVTAERKLTFATSRIVTYLEEIGKNEIEQEHNHVAGDVIQSLAAIGLRTINAGKELAWETMKVGNSLHFMGRKTGMEQRDTLEKIIKSFRLIINEILKKHFNYRSDKGVPDVISDVISSLGLLGWDSAKHFKGEEAKEILELLREVLERTKQLNLEEASQRAEYYIMQINKCLIELRPG